jgi:hypothetical protein
LGSILFVIVKDRLISKKVSTVAELCHIMVIIFCFGGMGYGGRKMSIEINKYI